MLKNLKKTNLLYLFFAILLSLPAIIGFLNSGFPQTDDGSWMIIRFSAFYEALRSGQFPVRFLLRLNNGFGYPVADFLYPLFMYLGTLIHVIGFNFTQTIKILFASSIIFSSVFTFLWFKKLFDNISSLVGAVFFTFFPYHLFDIYKRGSLGEALSFPIISFIFWQIERNSIFFSALGIFLLILSHNTLALFFIVLIIIYSILRNKTKKVFHSIFFGILLSSFFWIPAINDLQFTLFSATKVSDFNSYFSDTLTILLLGFGFFFLVFELIFDILRSRKSSTIYSLFVLVFISFFLFSFSKPIWNLLPFTSVIQFPFRLISVLIPISSFLVARLLNGKTKSKKLFVSLIYILLIFVSSLTFIKPKSFEFYPDDFYSTNQDTTTVKDEYMPKWVTQKPTFTTNKVELETGSEKINLEKFNDKQVVFNVFLTSSRNVKINVVYFPGWTARVNNIIQTIDYKRDGIINLSLKKGNNNVVVEFKDEGVRLIADILSIIGLVSLLVFIFKKNENF